MKRLFAFAALSTASLFAWPNPSGTCNITTASAQLPTAVSGQPYSFTFTSSGCAEPVRFVEIATGALPAGLAFTAVAPTTFTLSGTPSIPGNYVFAVRLFDLGFQFPSKTFTMKVESPVAILTPALSSITPNVAYSEQIRTSGGNGGLSFSIVEGSLPAGLTLLSSTGLISGTITSALPATGTVIRIRVTDLAGSSSEYPFTLVSNASPSPLWPLHPRVRLVLRTRSTSIPTSPVVVSSIPLASSRPDSPSLQPPASSPAPQPASACTIS